MTTHLSNFDKGKPLAFIEREGEILFTAEEVGHHLGYGDPAHAIHRIFRKNFNELKHYSVETKTVSTDGKNYETRAFTEEGVYILSMLARTNEAKKFRARVALLLRRIRREQAERMVELAREAGYAQGLAEGQSAPAVLIAERKAWLAGFAEGEGNAHRLTAAPEALLSLHPQRLITLKAALRYARMGLTGREIAKMLDGNHRQIGHLLSLARKVGLLAPYQRGPARQLAVALSVAREVARG